MQLNPDHTAYIDGANLHKGVEALGWKLDYKRFRVWLREKYQVKTAYLFLGLVPKHKDLYTSLQESGYTLIFKEVTYDAHGKVKGNCDADIVVRVMQDTYENKYDRAVIVASDGDYASLVSLLIEKQKLSLILSPAKVEKCSLLLKRTGAKISYLNDQRKLLEYRPKNKAVKEKAPDADRTA